MRKGDPGFEGAARAHIWNGVQPDRLPDVVAQVADVDDVIAAVNHARENGLKVTVRGGGHNWACTSMRAGGLLIDLAALNRVVSIDAENRKAVLEPVISNRQAQAFLRPYGRAFPSGHCPTVKLSGYLLSGGMSWNHGVWGPGCGSVEAIEMVTADGRLVTASATENPDLFWAARGAGSGQFAIAVRYHLRLYPLPKIACTAYSFPLSDAVEVAKWLGPLADELPPNVELSLWMLPEGESGMKCQVTATTFAESYEEAAEAVQPLESCPLMERCTERIFSRPSTFEAIFDLSGALWPEGLRSRVDAMFSDKPLADLCSATWEHFAKAPSRQAVYMYAVYTGGHAPATPADASFSMTGRLYGGPWTSWEHAADDTANTAWHEELVRLMAPYVHGHYISESSTVDHPEYLETALAPGVLGRIEEVRKVYDPSGLFFGFHEGLG